MKRAPSWLVVPLLVLGCAEEPPPQAQLPPLPAFELRDVVQPRIAELQARVAELDAAERVSWGPVPDELAEQVEGLVTFLTSAKGALIDAAFEDAQRLGPHALAPLIALYDAEASAEPARDRQRSILRIAGEYDVPDAARFLVRVATTDSDPLLRSTASWKLTRLDQDVVLPLLIKQLKYEKDAEAVAWLARALATQGNYAGLYPLTVLVGRQGPDGSANVALWEIAGAAGYANPFELRYAWDAGDPALRAEPRSAHFELELWNWIQVFTEFQLRGVDDGRYIITDLGAESVDEVAKALHDTNRYIRVHVAQSLGRMTRRGEDAADELAAALGDPIVAPYAAEALGEVCSTRHFKRKPGFDAYPPLASAALPGRDPGLQLSALRALGGLGEPRALDTLRAFAAPTAAPEFRQAALEGLVLSSDLLADPAEVRTHLHALIEHCQDPYVDAGSSMRAMLDWMQRMRAAEQPDGVAAPTPRFTLLDTALTRWEAWAPSPYVPPTTAENDARRSARLAIVVALLDGLASGATELAPTPLPPEAATDAVFLGSAAARLKTESEALDGESGASPIDPPK